MDLTFENARIRRSVCNTLLWCFMWNQLPSLKSVADQVAKDRRQVRDDDGETYVPAGYAETMDCLNKPEDWDVRGMIADMAENLRRGNEVQEGQVLAALDWMTFRLQSVEKAIETFRLEADRARELADCTSYSESDCYGTESTVLDHVVLGLESCMAGGRQRCVECGGKLDEEGTGEKCHLCCEYPNSQGAKNDDADANCAG